MKITQKKLMTRGPQKWSRLALSLQPKLSDLRYVLGNKVSVKILNDMRTTLLLVRVNMIHCIEKVIAASSTSTIWKGPAVSVHNEGLSQSPGITSLSVKSTSIASSNDILHRVNAEPCARAVPCAKAVQCLVPCWHVIFPHHMGYSCSLDEIMSTRGSMKSPGLEQISEHADAPEYILKKDVTVGVETTAMTVAVDSDENDPQLCATLACDMYRHLRVVQVLQMEAYVLKYSKFEMTAATTKCFLKRFVRVNQGCDEVSLLSLECLPSYVAELSLPEYNMHCYLHSLTAASSIFLSKFTLQPKNNPWNATLSHCTPLYKPTEQCHCVKAMHHLLCSCYTAAYQQSGTSTASTSTSLLQINNALSQFLWSILEMSELESTS